MNSYSKNQEYLKMKCEGKDEGEKKEKKTRGFGNFLCAQNRTQQKQTLQIQNLCSTFTTVNPIKPTPMMMKVGDNTAKDVYKHSELKLRKNIVWFDHKSIFTTHIQSELFL